jgi:hypothetical protein
MALTAALLGDPVAQGAIPSPQGRAGLCCWHPNAGALGDIAYRRSRRFHRG